MESKFNNYGSVRVTYSSNNTGNGWGYNKEINLKQFRLKRKQLQAKSRKYQGIFEE